MAAPFDAPQFANASAISRVAHVTPQTVRKWFRKGWIPHHKVPGSQEQRAHRQDVLDFLVREGREDLVRDASAEWRFPVRRVLLCTPDGILAGKLREVLLRSKGVPGLALWEEHRSVWMGAAAVQYQPHILIVDHTAFPVEAGYVWEVAQQAGGPSPRDFGIVVPDLVNHARGWYGKTDVDELAAAVERSFYGTTTGPGLDERPGSGAAPV